MRFPTTHSEQRRHTCRLIPDRCGILCHDFSGVRKVPPELQSLIVRSCAGGGNHQATQFSMFLADAGIRGGMSCAATGELEVIEYEYEK